MNQYDLFICHASEDKEEFVRPLVGRLMGFGLRVWYDEYALYPGDSLRERIDDGLATSARAVVVLSPHFFAKSWTSWELNGIVQRHLGPSQAQIIPIWLNVDAKTVRSFSLPLADIVAVRAAAGLDAAALGVVEALGRPIRHTVSMPLSVSNADSLIEMLGVIPTLLGFKSSEPVLVTLLIRTNDELVVKASTSENTRGGFRVGLSGSLSGRAAVGGYAIAVSDVERTFETTEMLPTKSMLAIPLMLEDGSAYGVLSLSSIVVGLFHNAFQDDRVSALCTLLSPLFRFILA